MSASLQKRAVFGTLWLGVGSLSTQLISFGIGILLARLLTPEDYGLVGMLGIFTAIASSLIDCGLGSALVRKTERTEVDCSTVYFYNIAASLILYAVLYAAAPLIADFYNQPILCSLTRVICISIVISSLSGVHSIKLYAELEFKKRTYISVSCIFVSGVIGAASAYQGYGVWSLVYMQLAASSCNTLLTWYAVRWVPKAVFSRRSFNEFFGFGSKMLLSGLMDTVYNNIQPLLIGKLYNGADLGYYTRASQYAKLPTLTVHGMFSGVVYPLLCKLQDDVSLLRDKWRMLVRLSCFVLFPISMGIAAVAEPFVSFFITEKWLPSVPMIRLLSFALLLYPVHGLNLDILRVVGRSDAILKAEVYKKILGCTIIVCTVPLGVIAMCWGAIVGSVVSFFINSYYTYSYIQVSRLSQCMDIIPVFLLSSFMAFSVWFMISFIPSPGLQLLVGIPVGGIIYIGFAALFRMSALTTACQLIRNNLRKS